MLGFRAVKSDLDFSESLINKPKRIKIEKQYLVDLTFILKDEIFKYINVFSSDYPALLLVNKEFNLIKQTSAGSCYQFFSKAMNINIPMHELSHGLSLELVNLREVRNVLSENNLFCISRHMNMRYPQMIEKVKEEIYQPIEALDDGSDDIVDEIYGLLVEDIKLIEFFPYRKINEEMFMFMLIQTYNERCKGENKMYALEEKELITPLYFASHELRDNKKFALNILRNAHGEGHFEEITPNGAEYRYLSARLQQDPEVFLAALESSGYVIGYAPHFQGNRDYALMAVTKDGGALRYLRAFNDDDEIVKVAVSNDSSAIIWASERLIQKHLFDVLID